jgi:hypothetical protein
VLLAPRQRAADMRLFPRRCGCLTTRRRAARHTVALRSKTRRRRRRAGKRPPEVDCKPKEDQHMRTSTSSLRELEHDERLAWLRLERYRARLAARPPVDYISSSRKLETLRRSWQLTAARLQRAREAADH